MARKFLYLVAVLIALFVAAGLVFQLAPDKVMRLAFVPSKPFAAPPVLPANRYADPHLWFARPGVSGDSLHWEPKGARPAQPVRAAVFFIHPTSYLARADWNAPLDDSESQDRAKLFLRGLASPFGAAAQVWAPRYRQAAFGAFFTDGPEGKQALDAAYGDVLTAFDQFVAEVPADLPIVLAGHSQGALHLAIGSHALEPRCGIVAAQVGRHITQLVKLACAGAERGLLARWCNHRIGHGVSSRRQVWVCRRYSGVHLYRITRLNRRYILHSGGIYLCSPLAFWL